MGRDSRIIKQRATGQGIDLKTLKMTGDRILLRLESPGVTGGGIVVPDNVEHDPIGLVVSNPGPRYGLSPDGMLLEDAPKVGDRVVFMPAGVVKISVQGETLLMLREPFIMAVLGPSEVIES